MSENYNYYNDREDEIDLIDLFLYICRKWRKLIIFFIIGAVIGCGISYAKMNKSDYDNLDGYFAGLDSGELNEELIDQYADYNKLYEEVVTRIDDSVILNMDPAAVYRGDLKYFIAAGNEDIDEISAYYNDFLNREGNWERLYKASNLDCSMNAFKELVDIWFAKTSLDNQIFADGNNIDSRSGSLYFGVITPTEESRDAVIKEMESMVNEASLESRKKYRDFSCLETEDDTGFGYNQNVVYQQADYAGLKQGYLYQITKIAENLSDDELLYYTYKYNPEAFEDADSGFSKKWPVIAAVGLAFVIACWYVLMYLLDSNVKSEDEISSRFGIQVLGCVAMNPAPKNAIDKLLYKLDSSRSVAPVSESYISSLINELNGVSIALTCGSSSENTVSLVNSLQKSDARLVNAGSFISDDKSIETVKNSDGIILIAEPGKLGKAELIRITELAKKLGKSIIGAVVIK